MSDKIIGFSIEIDGQKQILETGKAFGLLNTQLILVNDSLDKLASNSKESAKELSKNSKLSISSTDKLGSTFKNATKDYAKASRTIKDLGNGYFKAERAVKETSKELKRNKKAVRELTKEDLKRLRLLNKKINLSEKEEKELKELLKIQQLQRNVARERNAVAKQEAIIEKEGAKSRAGLKAQLALVTLELNKLTEAQATGTKRGRQLTKQQKSLNETLAVAEERGGRFGRRVGDYARSLLNADKVAKKAQRGLTRFALKLTVGRSVIDGLANGARAAIDGLRGIIDEADGTNEVFNEIENSGNRLTATLKNTGRNFLNAFGGVISTVIDNVAFVIDNVANSLSSASEEQGLFSKALNFGLSILKDFPAILGGIGGIIIELTGRFQRFGKETSLTFEQVKLSIQRAADIVRGRDVSAIDQRLKEVRQELEENTITAKSFSQAYQDAFNDTKTAQEEFKKRSQELAIEEKKQAEEREAREKRREARERAREEARKKALEVAKKLLKDQEKALSDTAKQRLARLSTIQELTQNIEDLQAEAIESNTERLLKQEDLRFDRSEEQRKANFEKIKQEIAQEQKTIEALFGVGSKEALENQEKAEAELLLLKQSFDQLAQEQERAHQNKINQITEEGIKARNDLLKSQAEARLGFIQSLDAQIEQTLLESTQEGTEKLLNQERERFAKLNEARRKAFEDYKKQLEEQSKQLETALVGDPQRLREEQEKIAQSLAEATAKNNQLAQEQERAHQNKLAEIREESSVQSSRAIRDASVSIYEQAAGALTSFLQIAADADKARFEASISEREESISSLNEKLQNATGLQKQALEKQVEQEKEALKKEQKAQKESERARAREAKAVGLAIAAINGAIAITRAFSDLGPIAGAVAAVGVAATLAVQIAEISSQKFQKGGILVGASHSQGGIPISVGGNRVVEAEGGEFIINRDSTAANLALIEAINDSKGRLKFQQGGILGSPSIAPNVRGSNVSDNNSSAELAAIKANSEAIKAINQNVQSLKVNLVYPELQEENEKNAKITQRTTL